MLHIITLQQKTEVNYLLITKIVLSYIFNVYN